jgi:hypothetical protein
VKTWSSLSHSARHPVAALGVKWDDGSKDTFCVGDTVVPNCGWLYEGQEVEIKEILPDHEPPRLWLWTPGKGGVFWVDLNAVTKKEGR